MENLNMYICLLIFLLTIISFALNKIPMAITSVCSMVALVFFGCLDGETALSGFSNSNTTVMASMFVISAGLNKTKMVKNIAKLVHKIGKGSFTPVLAGFVLITCLLAQFIPSSLATFSIVMPVALTTFTAMNVSPSKVMFALGITSIGTCNILPVGGGVLFPEFNGYLETYDYAQYSYSLMDTCYARLPILIVIVLYAIFIAPRFSPEKPVLEISIMQKSEQKESEALSPVREVLGYTIFILVMIGLLFESYIGIPIWQVSLAGAVLMVATGVLKDTEAYHAVMPNITLLYVGALALGNALINTGAGEMIGNSVANILGNTTNGYVIGLVFFLLPFILTQFMMNRSICSIFYPICILTCKALGCSPLGPLMLVVTAALASYMTPLATPTVSMVMGAGGYDVKTLAKMGWLPAIIICVVSVVWIMTIFPAYP